MGGQATVEVYYDGHCALCRASKEWAHRRDRDGRLRFLDFNDSALVTELPVAPAELTSQMWVREGDGRLTAGFSGWLAVLRVLPRWRWVSSVLALPPLRWLGPPLYRFVARNRNRLPLPAFLRSCHAGACEVPSANEGRKPPVP
jgi:predicted DCC family thiol-disulfide oxidoreductase YuxK